LEHKKEAFATAKEQWYLEHEKEKDQIKKQLNKQNEIFGHLKTSPCGNNKQKQSSCNKSKHAKSHNNFYYNDSSLASSDQVLLNNEGFIQFNSDVKRRLENELLEDQLIYSKAHYSFELNNRRLKVNGEKQTKRIFQKYLHLYEELTGGQMNGQSQIIIKNDNGHSETEYHSSNTQEIDTNKSFSCFSNSHGTYFFTATDSLDHNQEILLAMVELPNMIELSDYFEPNFDATDSKAPLKIYLKELDEKTKPQK